MKKHKAKMLSGGEYFAGFFPQRKFVPIPLEPRELVLCTLEQHLNEPSSASGDRRPIASESTELDASQWTTKEVYDFFKVKFPRQAHVFEDEEIDGYALYRLEREDVVQRLKLKLGPALKIYEYVVELQNKSK